jgi:hypothetical protein
MDGIGAGNVFGNLNYGGKPSANYRPSDDRSNCTPLSVLLQHVGPCERHAGAYAGHAVGFRERAQHNQFFVLRHEVAAHGRVGREMDVRFVEQQDGSLGLLARSHSIPSFGVTVPVGLLGLQT